MERMEQFNILKSRGMEITDRLETLRRDIVACGNTLDLDTRIEVMEMHGEYINLRNELKDIHSKIYKLSEEIINELDEGI